jgi:hypothetical protein
MIWPNRSYTHQQAEAEAVVKIASGMNEQIHEKRRPEARQPTETPRKQAIRMMLVK